MPLVRKRRGAAHASAPSRQMVRFQSLHRKISQRTFPQYPSNPKYTKPAHTQPTQRLNRRGAAFGSDAGTSVSTATQTYTPSPATSQQQASDSSRASAYASAI